MCGIAGHWTPADGEFEPSRVLTMLRRLGHRGPDGAGFQARPRLQLGHVRLAIHDLDARALQPFCSADGRYVVAVNGTFHNAPELRLSEQEERGAVFRTTSDSEVLLPLWRRLGPGCLPLLRGPFALAVHDTQTGELWLARDRLGQRPLFHARAGDGLLFASEAGALVAALERRTWSRSRAAAFLQCGYVAAPGTVIEELEQLPPGCLLHASGDGIGFERWWRPPVPDPEPDRAAAWSAFAAGLDEAVRLRLRSERELGVLLSGGLDSAGILAVLTDRGAPPVTAFTLGFRESALDERPAARDTARALGVPHVALEFDVEPGPWIQTLVGRTGELLADASWLAASRLLQQAAGQATVFLSGEGADELLLGYRRHAFCSLARRLGPLRLRRALTAIHPFLPRRRSTDGLLALRAGTVTGTLAELAALRPTQVLAPWLDPDVLPDPAPLHAALEALAGPDLPPAALAGLLDLQSYLPGDLLPKADRAAMASGVEIWCPYLDPPLVDLCLGMPEPWRLRGGRSKLPLRAMLERRLPKLARRRKKRGFAVPLAHWLQAGSYGRFARELLAAVRAPFEGVLRGGSALPLLQALQGGRRDLAPLVHATVVLALWHTEFLEGARREPPGAC